MADVASTTDDQKRALLAAVAQQGSAGADAYKQYADSVAAQRSAAVAAAQQRSSLINAGPAATSDLAGTATATADPYAKDAATGATAYANENSRLAQANSNYMEQLKAAIPLSANYAEGRINAAKSKQAGSGNALADLVQALGGVDLAKPQIAAALRGSLDANAENDVAKRTDQYNRDWEGKPNAFAIPLHALQAGVKADATSPAAAKQAINALETAQGIPVGALSAFLGKESPDYEAPPSAAEKSKTATNDVKRDPVYQSVLKNAQAQINSYADQKDKKGKHVMTRTQAKSQVVTDLRTDPRYSSGERQDIYNQIIKDLR